ncbi:BLUF domain-containing protein [Granulosicoccus antarcticus]|uniref:Blue light-and temperature-regulated antirepressor BluF n=1 Tax=Granulosicoccus antarcticus IMCC3135 TaxID=1192854 RepID=A0A2Z2NJU4_9GAMM|nr:BLUF domain-containing protein [Granulosicoccus antarcticus]ASJ70775.1 Blue light- and temperature-regulated antirepressor BluF [Granulosicoccus antarcticus IMCC3135]
MKDSLVRVVYVSRNTITGDDEHISREVVKILDSARASNASSGVTGALMFNRGLFAQVLEGPPDRVEQTFERIQCDERHAEVSLLAYDVITERSFNQWSMAYLGAKSGRPAKLLDLAQDTGFDPKRLDGNEVHAALQAMLLEADH